MSKEIERKFLVKAGVDPALLGGEAVVMVQAYLSTDPRATVRVRIAGDRAKLTVKGLNNSIERDEWEYPIPTADAREMIARCASDKAIVIEKTRFKVGRWEVDKYDGALAGLVVAEIELTDGDEKIELPDWVGREVSGDVRYYNSVLADKGMPTSEV